MVELEPICVFIDEKIIKTGDCLDKVKAIIHVYGCIVLSVFQG